METGFEHYFLKATPGRSMQPHDWQRELAKHDECRSRLIRIPTGFGKTLGVLAAWLWNRVQRRDERWPRRLVWCLPMRVLVEQTENEVRAVLDALNLLWVGGGHGGKVGVHQLMGGSDSGDWHLYPEECAVLIGTQDMLLSRAMNRGYGAARARWPMEFGLLNQDCLWVMDEVQLMDAGLATSTQLQAFRDDDLGSGKSIRPCRTWWMSATLQPEWLEKSPDTGSMLANLPPATRIPPERRVGELWDADKVAKPCRLEKTTEKRFPDLIATEHMNAGCGANGPTLVVINTVERAAAVYEALQKDKRLSGVDLRLVHSRFRPNERAPWREAFLNRSACAPGTNRIIIATQVVEAGVDISAGLLITELAPWSSLVQRFGRSARWGGRSEVVIADLELKNPLPYDMKEIQTAREAITCLTDVSPLHLESFEEQHPELLDGLYPYDPKHLLLRRELDELFDTTPDLSGADIDISRFIRSGDERDLQLFWAEIPEKTVPPSDLRPVREALCPLSFLKARDWLCGEETKSNRKPRLKEKMRAWVWDWLDGVWRAAERKDLYPGQTVMVAVDCGGYDEDKGWTGRREDLNFAPVTAITGEDADSSQDGESGSRLPVWQTIATHGRETGLLAGRIVGQTATALAALFDLAGRWHDVGKSHELFQGMIIGSDRPERGDLAKAPDKSWSNKRSSGIRHELASVLGLFAVLQRHRPDHPALLGPWRNLLTAAGMPPDAHTPSGKEPSPIENEIISLSADQFNLLAYLVCAHHGKVRVAWHSCPADQGKNDGILRIHGVQEGHTLPELPLYGADGRLSSLPQATLTLAPASVGLNRHTGQGWTERVLNLLGIYGPFTLAWLEALLRAADQRASRDAAMDELLAKEVIS